MRRTVVEAAPQPRQRICHVSPCVEPRTIASPPKPGRMQQTLLWTTVLRALRMFKALREMVDRLGVVCTLLLTVAFAMPAFESHAFAAETSGGIQVVKGSPALMLNVPTAARPAPKIAVMGPTPPCSATWRRRVSSRSSASPRRGATASRARPCAGRGSIKTLKTY